MGHEPDVLVELAEEIRLDAGERIVIGILVVVEIGPVGPLEIEQPAPTDACSGGGLPPFVDPARAGDDLAQVLDARPRILLILDDVWYPQQLDPFLRGGRLTTRLVTTRIRDMEERAEFCEITGGHEPMPENADLCATCLAPLNR